MSLRFGGVSLADGFVRLRHGLLVRYVSALGTPQICAARPLVLPSTSVNRSIIVPSGNTETRRAPPFSAATPACCARRATVTPDRLVGRALIAHADIRGSAPRADCPPFAACSIVGPDHALIVDHPWVPVAIHCDAHGSAAD